MSATYVAVEAASEVTGAAKLERPNFLQLAGSRRAENGWVLLRNLGGRPLRVRAELLAEGGNRELGAPAWHEVAIYRTDAGQVAVALRFLRRHAQDLGVHRAKLFDTLDAAASWLESFDTSADLAVEFDVADRSVSAACVALKAAALRERAEAIDRAYLGLIGEILFRLEADV